MRIFLFYFCINQNTLHSNLNRPNFRLYSNDLLQQQQQKHKPNQFKHNFHQIEIRCCIIRPKTINKSANSIFFFFEKNHLESISSAFNFYIKYTYILYIFIYYKFLNKSVNNIFA